MKDAARFLFSYVYGGILSCLLFLAFHFAAPWMLPWKGLAVALYVLIIHVLFPRTCLWAVRFFAFFFTTPFRWVRVSVPCACYTAMWFAALGLFALLEPWYLHPHGARQIVVAVFLDIDAVAVFYVFAKALLIWSQLSEAPKENGEGEVPESGSEEIACPVPATQGRRAGRVKKALYFVGSLLYGAVASALLFLVFRLNAPRFVAHVIWRTTIEHDYSLKTPIVVLFLFLALYPLVRLCVNKACRIAATVPLAFYGFAAILEPWFRGMPGSGDDAVAVVLSFVGVLLFGAAVTVLWVCSKNKEGI